MANLDRIQQMTERLPEAQRVDILAWDGEPTFRVRGKNFVFSDPTGRHISVKLPKLEAEAVVATVEVLSVIQFVIAVVALVFTAVLTAIIAFVVKPLGWRVSKEDEATGIDETEHAETAYELA